MTTTRLSIDHTADLQLFCPHCDTLIEEAHLHRAMVLECDTCMGEVEVTVVVVAP